MRRVASLCALFLAANVVACGDDETSKPDTVDTSADVVPDASPDATDAAPEVEDTTPEVADTEPDTTPDVADTEPDVADTEPDAEPDVTDVVPDTAPEVEPDVADVEPDDAPDVADVESDDTNADTEDANDAEEDTLGDAAADADVTGDTPQPVSSQGWLVAAETPVLSEAGDTVTGGITFIRQSGAETRGGGVCVVADLHDSTPCETMADCVGTLPAFSESYYPGGYYYCATLNGAGAKRCWTRPGAYLAYCFRGSNHSPGTYSTPAVPALVDGAATLWTSFACLADESNPAGCAGTENVTTTGPTLLVSP